MASGRVRLTLTKVSGAVINLGVSGGGSMATLQSRPLQLHPQGKQIYVDGVRLELQGASGFVDAIMKVGWTDALDDDINWAPEYNLANANTIYDFHMEGRYFHLYLQDRQVQNQWKLAAIEFYGRPLRGRTK